MISNRAVKYVGKILLISISGVFLCLICTPGLMASNVTSLTPEPITISDRNAVNNGFSITVVFNQDMQTTTVPSITFPVENPLSTISKDTTASGWINATTYKAVYDVTDVNSKLMNIDVSVQGAIDADGNTAQAYTLANAFNIDTQPGVIYVKANATGANNGTDWNNAFTSVVTGLSFANDNDTVIVYAGLTYSEPAFTWTDKNNVTLISTSPLNPNGTVIQSNAGAEFVTTAKNITNTKIQGLTFKAFVKPGYGGAFNLESNNSIEFRNCRFLENSSTYGGAIAVGQGCVLTVYCCTFYNNGAYNGGAIFNHQGIVNITDGHFDFNGGTKTIGGGAIANYSESTDTSTTLCTILSGQFTTNRAESGGGGAISNYSDGPAVTLKLYNGVFYKNTTTSSGGAIYQAGTSALVSSAITNCTFNSNDGAAIRDVSSGTCTVKNIIAWGTSDVVIGSTASSNKSISNSNIKSTPLHFTSISNQINSDPLFYNASVGDLWLKSTSPCINAANSSGAPSLDYLGIGRTRFGGATPDIGAYEFIQTSNIKKISAATKSEDFQMITLGQDVSRESTWSLLRRYFGVYDIYSWRVFRWDASAGGFKEAGDIEGINDRNVEPCRAYWLISIDAKDMQFAPLVNHYQSTEMLLKPGYNMIGNPYLVSLSTSNLQIRSENDPNYKPFGTYTGPLYNWNSSTATFNTTSVLAPYKGYYIENNTGVNVYIKINAPSSP